MAEFKMDDYVDVAARIREFKALHPEGCLQPADPAKPYEIVALGGHTFLVYVAAAYRSPDDPRPGIGSAWEPFPGKTPYTRDSELQNAETSAWGRAIIAALAGDTRKGVASAEDVRNRKADQAAPPDPGVVVRHDLRQRITALPVEQREKIRKFCDDHKIPRVTSRMSDEEVEQVTAEVDRLVSPSPEPPQSPPESPESAAAASNGAEDPSPLPISSTALEDAIMRVAALDSSEVLIQLTDRSLKAGRTDAERRRALAAALAEEGK